MRSLMVSLAVLAVSMTSMVGCASKEDEVARGSDSAFTEAAPAEGAPAEKPAAAPGKSLWDRLVGADSTAYKSGGASACGHFLKLTRGVSNGRGTYEYRFTACDDDGNPTSMVGTQTGDFVVNAAGVMALTEATVELRPSGPSFRVIQPSIDSNLPAGTLILEASTDKAQLIPEGFVD